jgi:hypothetical protein
MAVRALASGLALLLGGCTAAAPAPPAPAAPDWVEASLPAPEGPPGQLAVRDAAGCGDRWYAVGGVLGPGDASRPAAWASTDGRSWRSVRFVPLPGSYYGPQNLIYSVACAGGRVAMIGARPGGAHGNPRVSTWRLRPDDSMAEVSAPFETYGGDSAVNVAHIAAGPDGFLITGNRTSGAAIWLSPDGAAFRLVENAPGLADDASHLSFARDAVDGADGQWVVVGGISPKKSADEVPAVWLTRDGSGFAHPPVPAPAGYNELQRVVRLGDDLVAVGPRGGALGAWRAHAGVWTREGAFPGTRVESVAVARGSLITSTGTGLWRSADRGRSWQALAPPAGASAPVAVAGRSDAVLLAAGGRVWTLAE